MRDAAVLSAIGIGADERRRVLGVSVALSEAEVRWDEWSGASAGVRVLFAFWLFGRRMLASEGESAEVVHGKRDRAALCGEA
jgi:hypothetical protein